MLKTIQTADHKGTPEQAPIPHYFHPDDYAARRLQPRPDRQRPADAYGDQEPISDAARLEEAAWGEPGHQYQRRTARPGYELTSHDAPARRITVQQRYSTREAGPRSVRRTVTVPQLVLSGQWLAWCGLTPGTVAHIEVNPSSLVITPAAPGSVTASRAGEPGAGYGTGPRVCPQCDGWGRVGGAYFGAPDNEACDGCAGTGIIGQQPASRAGEPTVSCGATQAQPCSWCKGSGHGWGIRSEEACAFCDGTGKVEPDEYAGEDEEPDDQPASAFPARLIPLDGAVEEAQPENGSSFCLAELYRLLQCRLVEVVNLDEASEEILIIDEEGALPARPQVNLVASLLWWGRVPEAFGQPLCGRVLHCHTTQFR